MALVQFIRTLLSASILAQENTIGIGKTFSLCGEWRSTPTRGPERVWNSKCVLEAFVARNVMYTLVWTTDDKADYRGWMSRLISHGIFEREECETAFICHSGDGSGGWLGAARSCGKENAQVRPLRVASLFNIFNKHATDARTTLSRSGTSSARATRGSPTPPASRATGTS